MANVKQQLDNPALPSLGLSGAVYSQDVQNQNNGILRLFFTKVVNVLGSLIGPSGGKYINNPYGVFLDTTDQVAANTTTAYPVTLNTTNLSNGVSVVSNSRITVAFDGIWNLQFSIQFKNTTNDGQDFDIWFRKNGVNIDNSNSRFHLPARKILADPSHVIAALNFMESLVTGDYIEIVWRTTDTGVSIEHFAASTSPTRPAVPSAIVTMTFVSNLPNL
jgi:hypothetical protein